MCYAIPKELCKAYRGDQNSFSMLLGLERRRLPLPVNNRSCGQHRCPCWWQPWPLWLPLAGWPLAVAPYELVVGGRSLRRIAADRPCGRHAASGYARGRLLPLRAGPSNIQRPPYRGP
ncbi:hypothetical protein B296_00012220 [Ensete ventricosum]|uniref:Uncharacterized protein n=1 Tax=Ensete ventricosum TaxID=4639 RepID=A0A426Z5K4_ENSVE|nr:hypothetical protein B296_00012220 [Ensete ventricosum]